MDILIDNINIKETWGLDVLNYLPALGFASERTNERVWSDKSGVDKNLSNIKYNSRDFTLQFLVKENNELLTYEAIEQMVTYMKSKGIFILTLRDNSRNIRKSFLCERNEDIVPDINVRHQNSIYVCRVGFRDINPNAIVYYETVLNNSVTINYDKGRIADVYWGNGERGEVDNSRDYTKDDYSINEDVTIIIDIDKDESIIYGITSEFSSNITSGVIPQEIQFTDESTGDISIWSWDFGDGYTSSEQNPSHTYTSPGVYDVTLQVINSQGGYSTIVKQAYISLRNARMLVNATDFALKNDSVEYGLIN